MQDLGLLVIISEALRLTILFATPYLFASLGEVFVQRSGVLNLGVEGMMLMGAFTAIYVVSDSWLNQSPWVGLLAAALVGAVLGLATAVVNVSFKAEQGISGIGFTLLGLGLSTLLFRELAGGVITADGFEPIIFPDFLRDFAIGDLALGKIFLQHNILVYAAFALVPISVWVLNRTRWGLQIRAVGQNPAAADSMGVNVARVRYGTIILGGVLAGIAGASLSIALQNVFQENMTEGRGFIAVALVYFGGWSPWRVMAGALLFSMANNLQIWAQILGLNLPPNLLVMAPYVLTIVVLIFARQRARVEPAALTKPFTRGEN